MKPLLKNLNSMSDLDSRSSLYFWHWAYCLTLSRHIIFVEQEREWIRWTGLYRGGWRWERGEAIPGRAHGKTFLYRVKKMLWLGWNTWKVRMDNEERNLKSLIGIRMLGYRFCTLLFFFWAGDWCYCPSTILGPQPTDFEGRVFLCFN